MDLQSLRFFRTVASEGSFSKAAHKLNYAQSNLSTKILQLERELQVTLLYRHSHGVSLTPKGELLLTYADELLRLADETSRVIADDGTAKGALTIGSMESTAISFLPQLLSSYHRDNPNVSITVKTGTTEAAIRGVLEHTLDGAFVAGNLNHPDLETRFVKNEHLMLVTSSVDSLPLTPEYLSGESLLVFPQGCSYRRILEQWLKDQNIFSENVMEFDSLGAIIASISAGLGISLFPESAVRAYASGGILTCHEIPPEYALVPIVFVYRKHEFIESSLQNFIDSIQI
ncbi:MAG: LysR family transcriptional regulator [Clostridia bacterium]|nr:LysR family transcriptional regulator [Lachnospiraceae bacterium]NCB99734.1 LysR family transcriptional regulator [Clostridia bacterium]NCD01694.1 LysR family transcriptional regulator [Clostridia bacterium]